MNYRFNCKECGQILTLRTLTHVFTCIDCGTIVYQPGDKFIGRAIGVNKFNSKVLYRENVRDRNVYAVPMAEDLACNLCTTKIEFIQKVKNREISGIKLLEEKDFVRRRG